MQFIKLTSAGKKGPLYINLNDIDSFGIWDFVWVNHELVPEIVTEYLGSKVSTLRGRLVFSVLETPEEIEHLISKALGDYKEWVSK